MALVGPWLDSTGSGYLFPAAYLVAHERVDTERLTVVVDVKIWASSGLTGHRPVYHKTRSLPSGLSDALCSTVEGRVYTGLLTLPAFSGMSTTA